MNGFEYSRVTSVADAVRAITGAPDAKVLAGGQSLLPAMKLKLSSPGAIIDLSGIAELSSIAHEGGWLFLGAMTTHADVANSPAVKTALPGLARLAGGIGDPHVRNRGTIGGSLANNDPSADYPAAILALDASLKTTKRAIASDNFFRAIFSTALTEDEILTEIAIPIPGRFAYAKFANPASRFALVGVAVADTQTGVRVAVTGAGLGGVFRVTKMEEALTKSFTVSALDGIAVDPLRLSSDIHAAADYRAHLIGVLARRAVAMAAAASN